MFSVVKSIGFVLLCLLSKARDREECGIKPYMCSRYFILELINLKIEFEKHMVLANFRSLRKRMSPYSLLSLFSGPDYWGLFMN
jgi:hypothetical protein